MIEYPFDPEGPCPKCGHENTLTPAKGFDGLFCARLDCDFKWLHGMKPLWDETVTPRKLIGYVDAWGISKGSMEFDAVTFNGMKFTGSVPL